MSTKNNLDSVIYFLMDKAMRASKKKSIKVFKEEGLPITIDQWVVLRRIYEEKSQTQVQLAKATLKDTASITRILDLLKTKELIIREAHKSDRRKSALVLTKKGEAMVESAFEVVSGLRADGLKGLTKKEIEIANKVVSTIAKNMEN